jgi:hypothetical protein
MSDVTDDRSWDELSDAEKRFRLFIFDVYIMGLEFDLLGTRIADANKSLREFSHALSHHAARGGEAGG